MFSFFPCLPASEEPGFARPTIELPDYITANHRQGYRTEVVDLETAKQVWADVVRQVLQQGLWLGVRATMPRMTKK